MGTIPYWRPTGPILLALFLFAPPAVADVDDDFRAQVEERVQQLISSAERIDITASPVDGLFEVTVDGRVLYITDDARHVFAGNLMDMEERRNLTEAAEDRARAATIETMDEENMIVFRAPEERHVVTVFTDTECPYCRRMHQQMDAYHERGITIRYLAFPREGQGSRGWNNLAAIWCADDPNAAMDRGMNGGSIGSERCDDNPVEEHFNLAGAMGVRGTPSIITEGGTMLPGFVPPSNLLEALEEGR